MRVLIVDDNPSAREMVRRCLSGPAMKFRDCDDGDQVLAAYAEFLPDLVLMDYEMKRVNGIDATACIRSLYPTSRVVILTGHDDAELRLEARQAGAEAFVTKDNLFTLAEILRTEA